ncbi:MULTISPECIES: YkgJ family cysteine cluster protein [Prochlorococcus]|uniref:YkgJ family cysteine cluster protein n=1 Tax=Prochlorococcus TaxID=1218 RepID=UPI0005338A3C|nr:MULTISPECIES: YkgJ family cysteine cluster protein [Prochlorococcus]KGG12440.1 Fe-S cluster protein [Prochlorococcus sp. MIT 0601]
MKPKAHKWSCIANCGACCRLAPEERSEAVQALSTAEEEEYFRMVGNDGWCRHYDKANRKCTIYDERPSFCKVENFSKFFELNQYTTDYLAIKSCKENIRSIYGGKSTVLKRFQRNLDKTNK